MAAVALALLQEIRHVPAAELSRRNLTVNQDMHLVSSLLPSDIVSKLDKGED